LQALRIGVHDGSSDDFIPSAQPTQERRVRVQESSDSSDFEETSKITRPRGKLSRSTKLTKKLKKGTLKYIEYLP